VLIAAAFAAVWFMFPAPDTRHDLVSPSGAARIELGELCGDAGCDRVAILDVGGVRTGCPIAVEGNRPVFADVTAAWSDDEASVVLSHVGGDGSTDTLVIDLATCTITQ
jgi:hypothetical protein